MLCFKAIDEYFYNVQFNKAGVVALRMLSVLVI